MKKILYCALGAILMTGMTAQTQNSRPNRDARSDQRQQGNENLTPEQRAQNFQARLQERMQSMTPEQRAAIQERINQRLKDSGIDPNDPNALQKAQDAGLLGQGGQGGGGRGGRGARAAADAMKQMMEAAGIADFDTQDAIVAYVAEQNKARVTLLQLAQTAATALQVPVVAPVNVADNGAVEAADSKVATTFKAYENAAQAENDRQTKALADLDAKIHYSTTPRIKAFLTLVGILNNDVLAIGGPTAVFAPAQSQNGQGGWNGGQGQGGWNGGQGQGNGGWNGGNGRGNGG